MTNTAESLLPAVDGLEFRPLEEADLDAWLALVRRIAAFEQAPWHEQRSELAAAFLDALNPPGENTMGGFDATGQMRAAGRVVKNPGGTKAYAHGGVDPLWQRRGVGTAVLAWQEARAAARFCQEGQPSARVRSHTEAENTAREELLRARGFAVVRHYFEMRRTLVEIPVVPAPDGVTLLPWTEERGETARLAHNEAFADHWGSEPQNPQQWAVLMKHEQLRLDLSTLAQDDATGEVAGYLLSMHDPEGAEGRQEGYTEILGVRRAWRGQGMAPALLANAMELYRAAGLDHATLDVDSENPTGALGLYRRMGYEPVRSSMAWDKVL